MEYACVIVPIQRVIFSPVVFCCGVSGLSCKFTGCIARLKALSAACQAIQCMMCMCVYIYMCVCPCLFLCIAVQACLRARLVCVYVCARLCVDVRSEEEVAVFV